MNDKKVLIAMQAVHEHDDLKRMTVDALASIKCSHQWSVLVDDSVHSLPIKWNRAIDAAIDMDMDYLILVNNDVIFDEQCLDNLIEFQEDNPNYLVVGPTQYGPAFGIERPLYTNKIDEEKLHWSFVLFDPRRVLDAIGYCETLIKRGSFTDTEWQIRIDKLEYKIARTENSWFYHINDSTHRLLPHYKDVFFDNEAIVKRKWGVNYEYDKPYNDPNLSMRFFGEYHKDGKKF